MSMGEVVRCAVDVLLLRAGETPISGGERAGAARAGEARAGEARSGAVVGLSMCVASAV